jgi:mannosylglycoprotein endo-beta-mannosidase
VKLDLLNSAGQLVSTNFYWQNVAQDDFAGLEKLDKAKLGVTASSTVRGDTTRLTVVVRNESSRIALMTHLQLHRGISKDRVLPVFYSDNYLSLVPGESRTIFIECATADLVGESPLLEVDGFNAILASSTSEIPVVSNQNADPMLHSASQLVPRVFE